MKSFIQDETRFKIYFHVYHVGVAFDFHFPKGGTILNTR